MSDQKMQDFERKLDTMLEHVQFGKPVMQEDDDELMRVAHKLASTDLSGRSRIRESLYHQLTQKTKTQMNGGKSTMQVIYLKRVAAMLVTAVILVLAAPTLTTVAQTLLAQVGLLTVTDTQEIYPTSERVGETASPTATPIAINARDNIQTSPVTDLDGAMATNLSADAAAQIAGFDLVREPREVPAGYEFGGRIVLSNGNTTVDSFWQRPTSANHPFALFSISQTTGQRESSFGIGPQAETHNIGIGDLPATFIANADMSSSDGQLFNLLLWEEGPYTYMMSSPSLTQAEMLAMAVSMYR